MKICQVYQNKLTAVQEFGLQNSNPDALNGVSIFLESDQIPISVAQIISQRL